MKISIKNINEVVPKKDMGVLFIDEEDNKLKLKTFSSLTIYEIIPGVFSVRNMSDSYSKGNGDYYLYQEGASSLLNVYKHVTNNFYIFLEKNQNKYWVISNSLDNVNNGTILISDWAYRTEGENLSLPFNEGSNERTNWYASNSTESDVVSFDVDYSEEPEEEPEDPITPVTGPHFLVEGSSVSAANGQYFELDEDEIAKMSLTSNWNTSKGVYSNGSYVLIDDISYWGGWTIISIDYLNSAATSYYLYYQYGDTESPANDFSWTGNTNMGSNSSDPLVVTYVTGPMISVTTPITLTTAVNDEVNLQLEASDNTDGATLTFTLESGTLPAGLTLSNTGLISGIPTVESESSSYIINVTSTSGAESKQIVVTIRVKSEGQLYPDALLVAGAGNTNVNGIYDFTTVQSADAPTVGDKWGMYEGNDMYCIRLINALAYTSNGSYQTVKRYALYANNTSNYAYYADTVTGNEWPDDSSLTWAVYSSNYGGLSPAPTSVTATSPRVVLSRICAVSNMSNNFTFVSYNCPYTNSSSVPTADALYTCMQGTTLWQLKVEQTSGKYYWSMYNTMYNTITPMFKTFTGATSLSTLGWPWDHIDWNAETSASGMPVPEFSNPNGTETQNKGSFTGVASVWKTSMCDGTYTCYNYDINSATCKPYARFEATINGFNYCMCYNGYNWAIYNRTGTSTFTPTASATVSGSGESRTIPYPWDCTWSMNSGSTQIVPLVIKGDGSNGGINYGDFIVETSDGVETRFIYSNGSVVDVGVEPKSTDIWTSQDGTKTISWDSTNKWWVYKSGTTSVYHTPAYTSATPYQFPWEYDNNKWLSF